MDVFYFVRREEAHSHDISYIECLYIKSEDLVIAKEHNHHNDFYGINSNSTILAEAKSLEQDIDPYETERGPDIVGIAEFSKMKRFECDEVQIRKIIRDVRERDPLQEKIVSGIEDLISSVK